MLRKLRIIAALFCFLFITLLFLDFTGSIHAWFGWLAKIQFLPAVLALNCRRRAGTHHLDLDFRTYLLFGNLSYGCISRYRIQNQQPSEKEKIPFLLFTGHIMAEVRSIGRFHHRPRCRYQLFRFITRSLQLIRAGSCKTFLLRSTVGAITFWLILPNVQTVTLSIQPTCG